MKKIFWMRVALVCALVFPCSLLPAKSSPVVSSPAVSPAAAHGNADYITARQLQDYLTFIAADELAGRDTPSRGLDTAAKFIATNLSRWGLKPMGDDGTYFQRIGLRRTTIDPAQTRVEIDGERFNFGEDFIAQPVAATMSGALVYVGHGWVVKARNIDPYPGVDVKDKIMVVLAGRPEGMRRADFGGKRGEDWLSALDYAKKHGARGIVQIPDFRTLANWSQFRDRALERGAVEVEKFLAEEGAEMPMITASPALLEVLFSGEKERAATVFNKGFSGDPVAAFDFSPEKQLSVNIAIKSEAVWTQNVVAALEGAGRTLKKEYVALGAHYDHIGIGNPVAGDNIYNGADDDGSGTVAVLAIAEAFAKGPRPKRSILFVWHVGEEKGLWGSRYLTENPPVPLAQIVTQLNIDMIGRSKPADDTNPANDALSGPNEIYVIGSKMMSTELGALSEAVNKSYLGVSFNYRYDDPKDPNRFFFRSDHFNYAQKGIPIIFYFDGVHQDYHRPSDSVEKIDFTKMEKVARTVFATAWELSARSKRPLVDKKLPAELTAD